MTTRVAWRVVGHDEAGGVAVVDLDTEGKSLERRALTDEESVTLARDDAEVRWVWSDTTQWYPRLLAHGVRIPRAIDLRLSHAILRGSAFVHEPHRTALQAATAWDAAPITPDTGPATLFDVDGAGVLPHGIDDALDEFERQQRAIEASPERGRLRLLVAAESVGALIGVEMNAAGLPWHPPTHEQILEDELGRRSAAGEPERLRDLAERVRTELNDPAVSLDSQPKLLRALHRAGVFVESTSRWELREVDHPAIAPLIEYKRLSHLLSTNGWNWLSTWVSDNRFRPVYVPGGVVTGRWASAGGGALQIPRLLRPAVRADPGWLLVSADAQQLEPRVLAAMSGDRALAAAARGQDLYAGIAAAGVVGTRAEAKIAMLGAMYGATTGDSGRLLPSLRRAYGPAMKLVDDAAERGGHGEGVSTWWGRSASGAGESWRAAQRRASEQGATAAEVASARRAVGDRGRFTRNFVVQGTAAEWALAWLARVRQRLMAMPPVGRAVTLAPASGNAFEAVPHLAFFLHDEIIVHTPAECADEVAAHIRDAAEEAGALLFPGAAVDFPVAVQIAESSAKE